MTSNNLEIATPQNGIQRTRAEPHAVHLHPVHSQNLLTIISRRRFIVLLVMAGCLLAAVLFLWRATPLYTSTASVCVELNGPRLLSESEQTPVSPDRSDSYLYTQADVLCSFPILTAALGDPQVAQTSVIARATDPLAFLKKSLSIDVGKKSDVITVAFNAPSPAEATVVVNGVMNAYLEYVAQQRKGTTSEILKVLTDEKSRDDAGLASLQSQLLAFKQSNGDVFFKTIDKGTILMQDLATASEDVTQAKLLVAQAKAQLDVGSGKYLLDQQYRADVERLDNFQKIYDEIEAKANAINAKTAEYEKLLADIDRAQKTDDMLDARIKELQVTQDARPLNISILEPAHADRKPSFPKPALTLLGSVVVGAMLGIIAALIRDWMDQRLRTTDEINHLLGLRVLGVLPEVTDARSRATHRHMETAPASELSEAFRSLRTAIYLQAAAGSVKTVLITSPEAGEGKSTTASNLAISLAQAGKRTLLIDADLRKPVQHRAFGLERENGLSDLIIKCAPLEPTLKPTEIPGLDVLTCGSFAPNPTEVLNDPRFEKLLITLSQQYDQIIVYSSPVMPVADARILGAFCHVTVLVLRADKSTRKGSEHACERLEHVGAKLFGAVINGVSRRNGGYENYYQRAYSADGMEEYSVGLTQRKSYAFSATKEG